MMQAVLQRGALSHRCGQLSGFRLLATKPHRQQRPSGTQQKGQHKQGASEGTQQKGQQKQGASEPVRKSKDQIVSEHIRRVQDRSKTALWSKDSDKRPGNYDGPFFEDWEKMTDHEVPSTLNLPPSAREEKQKNSQAKDNEKQDSEKAYTDYAGLRFPTLATADHLWHGTPKGMDRVIERSFPIKVPGYRTLDPYLREYIHFLHKLDPARFTINRIAERYRLRPFTVAKVVQEWGTNLYLTRSGLTRLRERQVTRDAEVLQKKEAMYGKWVGFNQIGGEDDDAPSDDEETLGEWKGWRATQDWVRRQTIQVEMMSAFPMRGLRNPMPKRVDIDLCVDSQQSHKVINWIDPGDKVVF